MSGLSVLMGSACFPSGHWHRAVHRWKIGVRRASGQGPTHHTKGRKSEVGSKYLVKDV